MFFRNLFIWRFPEGSVAALRKLATLLPEHALREIGPLELETRGFVSPMGRGREEFTRTIGDFTLFALGWQTKILPASVVDRFLADKVDEIQHAENRRVGARERKRIKEEVTTQLLARAFVRHARCLAYVDMNERWLAIDTASRTVAEAVITALREAMGTFPATPLAPGESPRALMTDWMIHGKLPDGFDWGDECELRDPTEAGAIVRCRRQDLVSDEITEHLRSGKQVFLAGLSLNERMTFTLGEDLTVRKLRFLDGVLDELGEGNESVDMELDSRFTLMTLELRELFRRLDDTFDLPAGDTPVLKLRPGETPKEMRVAEAATRVVVGSSTIKFDPDAGAGTDTITVTVDPNATVSVGIASDDEDDVLELGVPAGLAGAIPTPVDVAEALRAALDERLAIELPAYPEHQRRSLGNVIEKGIAWALASKIVGLPALMAGMNIGTSTGDQVLREMEIRGLVTAEDDDGERRLLA